jgi:hypothetical protein
MYAIIPFATAGPHLAQIGRDFPLLHKYLVDDLNLRSCFVLVGFLTNNSEAGLHHAGIGH